MLSLAKINPSMFIYLIMKIKKLLHQGLKCMSKDQSNSNMIGFLTSNQRCHIIKLGYGAKIKIMSTKQLNKYEGTQFEFNLKSNIVNFYDNSSNSLLTIPKPLPYSAPPLGQPSTRGERAKNQGLRSKNGTTLKYRQNLLSTG